MTEQDARQITTVRQIVRDFAWQYFNDRLVWQAGQMVPGLDMHIIEQAGLTPDNILDRTMEPQEWLAMALFGAGLVNGDPGYIYEVCQGMAEWLFSLSDSGAYGIPAWWYETPMGYLWLSAFIRSQGDELITISEAAQLAGVTVTAMSERIAKGRLDAYPDPNESNPQRRMRVLRSDVLAWKPKHRRVKASHVVSTNFDKP